MLADDPRTLRPALATIAMQGPKGTLYEGGIYRLEMFVPPEYPFKPPRFLFTTPIYHVNVDDLGRICLSILLDDASLERRLSEI